MGPVSFIKSLIERKENEEVLALYGGGRYVLWEECKIWYAPVWHSWTNYFQATAPAVEQTFVRPLNAGWKPVHKQRMQPRNETGTIFNRIISAPTISSALEAPAANPYPLHLFQCQHQVKLQLLA